MSLAYFLRIGLLILLGLASGCTPLIQHPGVIAQTPELHARHFSAGDGAILPVRQWMPKDSSPKAIVLAVHGFNDYSNAFAMPCQYLSGQGIGCYAYDQRGFGQAPGSGLWPGISMLTHDLAQFTEILRQRHPGVPLYILGESMGAAVTLVAATEAEPLPVDGIILSAPAVWSRETMPWYQRALLATLSQTAPSLHLTGDGLGIVASDNIEILRGLGRDPFVIKATRVDAIRGLVDLMDLACNRAGQVKLPALVLYGDKDQVVPREPLMQTLRKIPETKGNRSVFYPQGYHLLLRDLHAETPWRDIAAWIEQPRDRDSIGQPDGQHVAMGVMDHAGRSGTEQSGETVPAMGTHHD
jgi:acylglycerol lipase